MPRDCLRIIVIKSKVRNSHNKPVVAKVSTSTSTPGISPDVAELKDMVKALLLDKKYQAPAPVVRGRALIDMYKGELTLRVGKEAVTFNLDQTSRYSSNYDDMMANRIDVIEMACEEYSQEVLGFSDVIAKGDILLLKSFLNDDPSLPPPTQGNYFPEIRNELKVCEAKTDKSSIDEPPKVELKDLLLISEYTF
ncbi:hypothetical protein Tco_1394654 [Tanacetum coccineum]